MKKHLTCLLMLCFLITNAQYERGTIYFNDGSTKQGLIKKRIFNGVKFKETKDSEIMIYDYNHISGYDMIDQFFRYKSDNNSSPILVEILIRGKINLYSLEKYSAGAPIAGGGGATYGGGTYYSIYFLEKGDEFIKLGRKVKKRNLVYFKDCPFIIEKLKSKELKGKNVYEIVDFYNTNCRLN